MLHRLSLRTLVIGTLLLVPAFGSASYAQNGESLPEMRIHQQNGTYTDAFRAFGAGDYKRAEAEFKQVESRLWRARDAGFERFIAGTAGAGDFLVEGVREPARASGDTGKDRSVEWLAESFTGQSPGYINHSGTITQQRPDNLVDGRRAASRRPASEIRRVERQDIAFSAHMIATSQLQMGDHDRAKRNFRKAVDYDEGMFDSRARLALLEIRDGNPRAADQHLATLKLQEENCAKLEADCINVEQLSSTISYLERLFLQSGPGGNSG